MGIDKAGLLRFSRYVAVGGSTFVLDLLLLLIAVQVMGFWYFPSVAASFFIAVSLNYAVSRHFVFSGTQRDWYEGYLYFVLFALFMAGVIAFSVAMLVEDLQVPYLTARVLVAAPVGMLSYLLNLRFNFMVNGQHSH